MIVTKSVYDPCEPSDGERILVTRYWVRGYSKERLALVEWRKELAPSKQLLHDWKTQRISWDEYEIRYEQEMASQQRAIAELAHRAKEGTISLLCFERENDLHCHRHLLKKMIVQLT